MESNTDRSRLIYLLLSIGIASLSLNSLYSFVYMSLALVLIANSKVEKANNKVLRISGIVTYTIYFVWVVLQLVVWFHSSFIG